nr:hypothetical protein [Providencia rettgeri]
MKTTVRYVSKKKPEPPGNKRPVPRAARKPLKYFSKSEYLYAVLFFGFIIFATMRFYNKQAEVETTEPLGRVVSIDSNSRDFSTMVITTNTTHFLVPRPTVFSIGSDLSLQKLVAGDYQVCVDGKEICTKVEKREYLAIRPLPWPF